MHFVVVVNDIGHNCIILVVYNLDFGFTTQVFFNTYKITYFISLVCGILHVNINIWNFAYTIKLQ